MNQAPQSFPLIPSVVSRWPGIAGIKDSTVELAPTATKAGGKLAPHMVVMFVDGSAASIMGEIGVPGFYEVAVLSDSGDKVIPQVPGSQLAGLIEKMGQERAGSTR